MSKLNYNGNIVNSVVSELNSISHVWDNLVSEIKTATNKIVSSRGFDKYIGGINSDSFSSLVFECQNYNINLIQLIRQIQIDVLAYSQDDDEIQAFLDELNVNDYKNLNLTPIESHISFGRKASNIFKGFSSALATAGLGLVEGLGNFGETGADLITLGKSAVCSIFTGTYDLITGSNTTEQMWEETKAKVSEKKVETAFNNFYSNNPIGQNIKNNAYAFDTVRGISNGIGYTAGIIGLNVVTGGLASGLGIGAAGSVGAGQLAATAGLMGFSSGTEDAWSDGASVGKGLMYGAATGAWEGAQWAIGAKINQYGGYGDRIASGIFKGGKSGAITRITLDAADSGLEGIVQPGLKMIYKDYDGNSLFEKYKNAFQEAGGWNNVGMQAIMGGVMSAGSELIDARKILKSSKDAKINGDASEQRIDYRGEMASDDVLQRELMEDQMARAGDFSKHSRATIDGDYIRTADTEFNTVTRVSGKSPDGSIKFVDGSYVPAHQTRGSLFGTETQYDGTSFRTLLEQRRNNLSGYDYTRFKDASEIFASYGKRFNMTELKLILNHSEGNINRIKSAITMFDASISSQELNVLSNTLSSTLFSGVERNMGSNIERGIANTFIDEMQKNGTDTWRNASTLFEDYYSYETALKNIRTSTATERLTKLENLFGKGMISDSLAKRIVNSDGYPETIIKLLETDVNIPSYQRKSLSEMISSKVFTYENAARVKAQYEIYKGNYDKATNLVSNSGTLFESTASLFRASETFSQRAKRYVYYNSIDSSMNFGFSKSDAMRSTKSMYAYAMDMVGTNEAIESARNLFRSTEDIFGYNTLVDQYNFTGSSSSISPYMNRYLFDGSVGRTYVVDDFVTFLRGKNSGTGRPSYVRLDEVDVTKSLEAQKVFRDSYINAAYGSASMESLRVMTKLMEIDQSGSPLYIYNNGGKSCSHRCLDSINLANQTIDAKNAGTVFHETGHYLFGKVLGEKVPDGFSNARINAISNLYGSANSQLLSKFKTNVAEIRYFADYKSTSALKADLANRGYVSLDAYKKHLVDVYSGQSVSSRVETLKRNTMTTGMMYSKKFEKEIVPNFDFDDALNCANLEMNSMRRKSMDAVSRSIGSYSEVTEMIDSLTYSKDNYWYGHTREYFEGARNPDRNSFHELIADYTSLRVRGETQSIGLLRQLFGNEVMDMLENTYQSMVN